MKKVFGIIMLMLVFVGVTMSAPTVDVEGTQIEFVVSQDVASVAIESPTVLTFIDVDNPILYKTVSVESLGSFEPDLETDIIKTLIDTETLDDFNETEVVATPLDLKEVTNKEPLNNLTENEKFIKNKSGANFNETEVLTAPLDYSNSTTLNATITTNFKEVLLEYI